MNSKKYNDQYIIENRDKIKARAHEYYLKHIDAFKIKNAKYRHEHPLKKIKKNRKVDMNTTPSDGKLIF